MRIGKLEGKKKVPHHGEQVILFAIGNYTFACAANSVDEIRALDGLQPVAGVFAHSRLARVKFTLEREGKTYFVVDSNLHFHILPSKATRLLVMRDIRVAVLVDSIDRMAEIPVIHPLPRAFTGEERNWYRGMAIIGQDVIPVINPATFLSRAELAIVEADLMKAAAKAVTA